MAFETVVCSHRQTPKTPKTSTTEQSRNIAHSLMLSNKRLLTLASPIHRYYLEWLEQYTLLPPLICDTLVSENKHSPACSTASMLWPSPIFTGFTLLNVIRNVTSTRRSGDTPIHPDNTVLKPVPGSGSRANCAQFHGSSDAKHVSSWFQPWATLWPTCHMLVLTASFLLNV